MFDSKELLFIIVNERISVDPRNFNGQIKVVLGMVFIVGSHI